MPRIAVCASWIRLPGLQRPASTLRKHACNRRTTNACATGLVSSRSWSGISFSPRAGLILQACAIGRQMLAKQEGAEAPAWLGPPRRRTWRQVAIVFANVIAVELVADVVGWPRGRVFGFIVAFR